MKFAVRDLLWAALPDRTPSGHEQEGHRPVLVVGTPTTIQSIPYDIIWVIPLTRTRLKGPLFPILPTGTGGLPSDSAALIYQLTSIDSSRILGTIGKLTLDELKPIIEQIFEILKLPSTKDISIG